MKSQLLTMLSLQDQMNSKVTADWRAQNYEWYRAIWTECAELMDHYGWKWWKAQTPDIEQSKLELIDIWHFALSIELMAESDVDKIAQAIESAWHQQKPSKDFRVAIEDFANATLSSKSFDLSLFIDLMLLMNMTFEELYVSYVGKNVLNLFRQDHGYKDGSYIKIWNGLEDNEHLVAISSKLDTSASDFKDKLYQGLSDVYQTL